MRTITPTAINEKYEECRVRRHEKMDAAIAVPGFMATSHAFQKRKLERQRLFVTAALKLLPKNIRRSAGCDGVPWFLARRIVSQDREYGLDVVDKLLSMAVALNLVTVKHPDGLPTDTAYIIIEDLLAIRLCKINKEYRHTKWKD